jgi:hypothetical protein
MADEKVSSDGSIGKERPTALQLDDRRRAALAEIDNAPFSSVFSSLSPQF